MTVKKTNPGLMIGIEVHQRLDSGKLFCNCSFNTVKDSEAAEGSAYFTRRLRAVTGELGVIDPSASFEAARNREFHYTSPLKYACLIEEDDQPPNLINKEALETALKISLALKGDVLDEVFVMRKTVVDGSAVSGFQRTALISLGGRIETSRGPVGIQTVCVEEESSTIVDSEAKQGKATFRLDRLGVSLVEIATTPDIHDAEHARETALEIGRLLRSIGGVQRGIGTIRQDLNLSIDGGSRVEIKGVQELALMPKLVDNEILRQRRLIEVQEIVRKKPVPAQSSFAIKSVADAFSGESKCAFITTALASKHQVMALKLEGFAGLLKLELMPSHRLGTEFSDYAKAAAGVNGIIHSDEDLSKYPISETEAKAVAKELGCSNEDAWAICVGVESRAVKALTAVAGRALNCWNGVLKETRKADGERTRFMRPLPGSARMYPETDVPPVAIDSRVLTRLTNGLPLPMSEQINELEIMGLNQQAAKMIVEEGLKEKLLRLVDDSKASPMDVATVLTQELTRLQREGVNVNNLSDDALRDSLSMMARKEITRAALPLVLTLACKETTKRASELVKEANLSAYTMGELEAVVRGHLGESPKAVFQTIMREHRIKAHPDMLSKLLGQ